jgi:predicted anti-sigma-YlaC factor YlaD
MELTEACAEAMVLLSQRLDMTPTSVESARALAHLEVCAACRTAAEQMGFVHRAVRLLRELHSHKPLPGRRHG